MWVSRKQWDRVQTRLKNLELGIMEDYELSRFIREVEVYVPTGQGSATAPVPLASVINALVRKAKLQAVPAAPAQAARLV